MATLSKAPFVSELMRGECEVPEKHCISEDDLWSTAAPRIWKAQRFHGSPAFYPVYRYDDYYSFSPVPLILRKGRLRINGGFARECGRPEFVAYAGKETIDREIVRLGGPFSFDPDIESEDTLVSEVVEALRDDIRRIEDLNPGYTNVVFCAGKDSLNLLLLPWKNPILAVSGAPNDTLVREFVKKNGLGIDVRTLANEQDDEVLTAEILANACFLSLDHCRWGTDIVRISRELGPKTVAWFGQLADTFLTPYWRTYCTFPRNSIGRFKRRIQRKLNWENWFPQSPAVFAQTLWSRGAMWQGAHLQQMRFLTGALTLSAYHGPRMRLLLPRINLERAVTRDVRPMIGEALFGNPVWYPSVNPGPLTIPYRSRLHHPHRFVAALKPLFPEETFV